MNTDQKLAASFRDPSGFLFHRDGVLYRQVNTVYRPHYDRLMASGLYDRLVKSGALIAHEETNLSGEDQALSYRVIRPEPVHFISYPYEWSFSQLKDAALLTLDLVKRALADGLILKDASAYNIQFHHGRPVLIDTLSFETYTEGQPWVAYRQFCQHFLAPLALMALRDVRLLQLLRVHIDGIALDLASSLLPWSSHLNFGLMVHIHTHAGVQKRYAGQPVQGGSSRGGMTKMALLGLIDSLESTVKKLEWKPAGTEWGDYYDATNYTQDAFQEKRTLLRTFLTTAAPQSVWDLGANTGEFSRTASEMGIPTLTFDIDPAAVEKGYRQVRSKKEDNLLPLVMDLTNPSPALGWQNRERQSLIERGPAGAVLALALIHHLAISNNVPLPSTAELFSRLGRWLIIEFVPKEDSQVQRLLSSRVDIFDHYNRPDFETAFSQYFDIRAAQEISGSKRTLYLMEKRAV